MPVDIANLHIVHYPDPILRSRAEPIEDIDDDVRDVARRMIELMNETDGVGLAAPQVGLPWRMFVARSPENHDDTWVFINPKLTDLSREFDVSEEGCLSLPGLTADIRRPHAATIEATDVDGRMFTCSSSELDARIWQHEYDHLDGVLIIDKLSTMDRLAKRKQIKELEEAAQT